MRIHPHTHTHRTVILDEVDQLSVRGQDVLYRLFELPYLRNSKLILIGVCLCVCVWECNCICAYVCVSVGGWVGAAEFLCRGGPLYICVGAILHCPPCLQ